MFSRAAWALSHPQNVSLNEGRTLAAAAPIPAGSLRSGAVRLPLRVHRGHRAAAAPAALPAAAAAPAAAPPAADDDDDDGGFGGGDFGGDGDGDEEMEIDLPAPIAAAAAAAVPASAPANPLSQPAYDQAQLADQPRLPWAWATQGMATQPYVPSVGGKWWSRGVEELEAMPPSKRSDFGHIGRIMETELGKELKGADRCTACQRLGQECWVYSEKGASQVSRPGSTCARCRVTARSGGCSISKRKRRDRSPPPPGPRSLAALKPFGGPPPGAGGSGIAT